MGDKYAFQFVFGVIMEKHHFRITITFFIQYNNEIHVAELARVFGDNGMM